MNGADSNYRASPSTPPPRSDGTRRPPLKSKGSSRGFIVAGREFVAESNLERKILYCLLADRTVRRVRDQWPVVPYLDKDGRRHTHVFDFWIERTCGRREALAVKPSKKVEATRSGASSLAEVIAGISSRDLAPFADNADILTDTDVSKGAVYNARRILRARKYWNEADVTEALDFIRPLRGAVRFHDLLRGAPMPANRRIALWKLIDDGILVAADDGPINDACRVLVNQEYIAQRRAA